MMKKFNLWPGLIISVFIALIVLISSAIRLDQVEKSDIVLRNAGITFLIAISCWITNQYILSATWIRGKALKTGLALTACALVAIVILYPLREMQTESFPMMNLNGLPQDRKLMMMAFRGLMVGGLEYFVSFYLQLVTDSQNSRIENQRLKQENLEARLGLLKQQVNPHFLFNSLSTLRTIAADAPTKQYVMQLANVYRYLLRNEQEHLTSLERELEFARSYIYILQERFERALCVDIEILETSLNHRIPPYCLQILVENAVKHNIVSVEAPLSIRIYIESEMLCVENNVLPRMSVEVSTGKGLNNIKERYQLLSNQEIEIIRNSACFVVKLPLLK
ncbi:sensor histidine kinase [Dyadobacter sp. BHUBP1]|uniref:sensor histidine kinase n=1 Tax=Dyadobacter sp. BHUBP1 TaxID=3424178 RepID=UPI003D333800